MHLLARHELAVHLGGLAPPGLLALARVMDLWRVHPDIADLFEAIGDPHVDGVAVHDADDRGREAPERRRGRQSQEERQERQKQPADERHAPTVSPPAADCQTLETSRVRDVSYSTTLESCDDLVGLPRTLAWTR
ncbi:MAG: hypothetical protein DME15_19175 [Candidatus Rokuibacteriota bacterium]|nr:MAG: hypothetical protein DME15_19175 [Candidatus Rokubacteria bacterium]